MPVPAAAKKQLSRESYVVHGAAQGRVSVPKGRPYACACLYPLVVSLDQLLEVLIGNHTIRHTAATTDKLAAKIPVFRLSSSRKDSRPRGAPSKWRWTDPSPQSRGQRKKRSAALGSRKSSFTSVRDQMHGTPRSQL